MTKTKNYKHYGHTFKTYCKPVGNGWEVGMTFNNKSIFVGNFVHRAEANSWWSYFHREIRSFFHKYEYNSQGPTTWMTKFFGNYLYKSYYSWLDKKFTKYNREYSKACQKDSKYYQKMKPTWTKKFNSTRWAA
jgi:hypothetical protein